MRTAPHARLAHAVAPCRGSALRTRSRVDRSVPFPALARGSLQRERVFHCALLIQLNTEQMLPCRLSLRSGRFKLSLDTGTLHGATCTFSGSPVLRQRE